MVEIESDFIKQ